MILCSNPRAQYLTLKKDIDAAVLKVLDSGWYIRGAEVEAVEEEFAAHAGAAHAIGVASGTDALVVALSALGVGPGDEVITVSHTAVPTVSAIEQTGATPVFVDIEPACFTLDPERIEAMLTPRTKALVAVHLYGQPADMDAIMAVAGRHGLKVVEDCAQAAGAIYGSQGVGAIGDAGCFSFFPTKNLGTFGDGGMVITADGRLAERMRGVREYGWDGDKISQFPGLNSRLDELQAAIVRVRLRHLNGDNDRRRQVADFYDRALAGADIRLPVRRPAARHVFHLYVVRHSARDALRAFLKERGIAAAVHYEMPVHLQPAYRGRLPAGPLEHTERAALEVLTLPVYPELTQAELEKVAEAVLAFPELAAEAG